MGNIQHVALDYTEVHVPFSYSYANSTAREGDTGFVSGDLGKLALQTDENSLWLLTATTPTWAAAIITGAITVDTIDEDTPGAGVTIDGVLCKDNAVTASAGFTGNLTGAVTGVVTGSLIGNIRSTNGTVVVNTGSDGTDATATIETLNTSASGISGTAIKDEDDMVSDSATHLATQQSIKAYVDKGSIVYSEDNTRATYSSAASLIPIDGTIPQVGDGVNIAALDLTITPTKSSNYILVTVSVYLASVGGVSCVAVFNSDYSSPNDAIFVSAHGSDSAGAVHTTQYRILASDLNGTTATTFTVNIGSSNINPIYSLGYNQSYNGVFSHGGAQHSYITAQEIEA